MSASPVVIGTFLWLFFANTPKRLYINYQLDALIIIYSQLKLCTDRPPGTLVESVSTKCCMYTTVSS